MRLASLARKIGVTPSQITSYLEESGVELAQGSNTKLNEDQIESVLTYFNKELPQKEEPLSEKTEEIIEEVSEPQNIEEKEIEVPVEKVPEETLEETPVIEEPEVQEEPKPEPPVPVVDPSYLSKGQEEDEEELGLTEKAALDENIEIIKPPKVKLQGLTVKGKIDLPQPKPKEETAEEEVKEEEPVDPNKIIYTSGPKRERRKPKDRRSKKRDPNYNPVEAERKRKAREEAKEKERKQRAQKKAKADHYKKTVVQKTPVKKIDAPERTVEQSEIKHVSNGSPKKTPPKNIFAKFWRWMNT